jgi:hypothetical protein
MKILGCDLHAKQQSIAMVDTETGEFTEKTLSHEGNEVREFYAALGRSSGGGIEATGAMQWARSVDCNGAEGTASLVSGRLHQSKAGRTAALIRAIAAAGPGVGRASRKTSPATAPPLRWLAHPCVGAVTALATEVFLGDANRFANGDLRNTRPKK